MRYVEKHCRVEQATDYTMGHAHCMLDNKGYKHTLGTCYTYCFSRAKKKKAYTNVPYSYVIVLQGASSPLCLLEPKVIIL